MREWAIQNEPWLWVGGLVLVLVIIVGLRYYEKHIQPRQRRNELKTRLVNDLDRIQRMASIQRLQSQSGGLAPAKAEELLRSALDLEEAIRPLRTLIKRGSEEVLVAYEINRSLTEFGVMTLYDEPAIRYLDTHVTFVDAAFAEKWAAWVLRTTMSLAATEA